jgi:hypothetical protein
LSQILTKGLQNTTELWPPLERAYRFLDQAKAILANESQSIGQQVRERYLAHLAQMRSDLSALGLLAEAFEHFCHITDNFAAGLFQCYDIKELPRTNNDLEHCFGVARVHERRATGRRGAIPGVVVRGSVRVMAAVKSSEQVFSVEELRPKDYQRWRDLRRQLRQREEARRQQWRFRKNPPVYLAQIEAHLLDLSPPASQCEDERISCKNRPCEQSSVPKHRGKGEPTRRASSPFRLSASEPH